MKGVACDLDSPGFHALCRATEEVVGHVQPYSITGSLPCIRELQVGRGLEAGGRGRETHKWGFFFFEVGIFLGGWGDCLWEVVFSNLGFFFGCNLFRVFFFFFVFFCFFLLVCLCVL